MESLLSTRGDISALVGDVLLIISNSLIDEYVAWSFERTDENGDSVRGCAFVATGSKQVKEIGSAHIIQVRDWLYEYDHDRLGYTYWPVGDDDGFVIIEIREPTNYRQLKLPIDEKNHFIYRPIRNKKKLLFCFSTCAGGVLERIQIWRIDADPFRQPTQIQNCLFESRELRMEYADERFIMAIKTSQDSRFTTVYFISSKTMDDVRSFSVSKEDGIGYQGGLFFLNQRRRRGTIIIRIMDVASGTFYLKDLKLPIDEQTEPHVSTMEGLASCNSKVIVIGWNLLNPTTLKWLSGLSVYDREAVENNRKERGSRFLLYTLRIRKYVIFFRMDENVLAYIATSSTDTGLVESSCPRSVIILRFSEFPKL